MDGVIKKNSVLVLKRGEKEVKMEVGSAMPVSIGESISLTGNNLDGNYQLVDKKIDYKIESELHNLLITYVFELSN